MILWLYGSMNYVLDPTFGAETALSQDRTPLSLEVAQKDIAVNGPEADWN